MAYISIGGIEFLKDAHGVDCCVAADHDDTGRITGFVIHYPRFSVFCPDAEGVDIGHAAVVCWNKRPFECDVCPSIEKHFVVQQWAHFFYYPYKSPLRPEDLK